MEHTGQLIQTAGRYIYLPVPRGTRTRKQRNALNRVGCAGLRGVRRYIYLRTPARTARSAPAVGIYTYRGPCSRSFLRAHARGSRTGSARLAHAAGIYTCGVTLATTAAEVREAAPCRRGPSRSSSASRARHRSSRALGPSRISDSVGETGRLFSERDVRDSLFLETEAVSP